MVKAIEVTLEGSEPVVTGFARAEIPPGGSVAEAMVQVFSEGGFRSKRVVCGVAGQSTVVRYVPMMRMSEEDARSAIRFETDKYLPFDLEDVEMDCQIISTRAAAPVAAEGEEPAPAPANDQMTVLLAACRKELLEERATLLIEQGLIPVAIDLDLCSLANAWELCGLPLSEVPEDGTPRAVALVDVGASRTSINVLRGGESCFSREISIGGADMTQAIVRRLGVEGFEAEAIKRAADTHEAEVSAAIAPVLED